MAAQSGRSAFPDAAAVPVANGRADDCPEEVRQAGGAAGIYGMTCAKQKNFQAVLLLSRLPYSGSIRRGIYA